MSFGINLLILLINFLLFFKKVLVKSISFIAHKPLYGLSRFFFYKVVVKLYSAYLSFLKRLGWSGARNNLVAFVFGQKLVHVLVVSLTFTLIFVNLASKTRAETLANPAQKTILFNLITGEFAELEEDSEYIVEAFDTGAGISTQQQTYIDNSGVIRPQIGLGAEEELPEEEDVTDSTITRPDITETKVTKRQRTEIVEYTVKPGDSISTIAEEFGISVNTILWENDLSSYSVIRPGDELSILPVSGLSHSVVKGETLSSIARKYNATEEEILSVNRIADASRISIGQNLVIPGAKKSSLPSYKPKTYTGISAIKQIVTNDATPVASNKMFWPTDGHIITQYYSWKHTGLDIANKTGTPLYASDAGTVIYSGWSTGYGYNVLLDHGGGKKTRYAHASQLYVKVGDKVNKGQNIAAMGSTGWSTGPHIHFEVIINGKKLNPLNYIK